MICPKCGCDQSADRTVCDSCGVIFTKLAARRQNDPKKAAAPSSMAGDRFNRPKTTVAPLRELLFNVSAEEFRPFVAGRALVYLLMCIWGVRFIFASMASGLGSETVLHLVHLPFHEAGHVIFGLSGVRFIAVLGGTLGQVIIPTIVIGAFLLRRDQFGSAVGIWWLGQSFMDVAIYANDARTGQLMLLGGVTGSEVEDYHDWEVLLGTLGWLQYDHLIAGMLYTIGTILILLSLAWAGFILWHQAQKSPSPSGSAPNSLS